MVEEVRNKWCDDLEDLLQCPVCMERPKNSVFQCIQGHHICQTCKPQLGHCPTCAQRWSDSRNRFVEHLATKLDEIKLSLVDPESEINKLLIPETVSVASQTDEIVEDVAEAPKRPVDNHGGKVYPCRIGGCSTQRFYEPLLKHLIIDHAPQFSELVKGGPVFEHTWKFEFTEQMTFDRAFHIPDMGTFFLKLSSDVFGNFAGFILMIHNGFIAKSFTYQLEISCCEEHRNSIYTGEVCSCRTPLTVLLDKCLKVNRTEMQKLIDHHKRLNCTLLLGKKPDTDEPPEQIKPNVQKKKNPKKRFQSPKPPVNNGQNGTNPGPSSYQPVFNRLRPVTAPNDSAERSVNPREQDRPAFLRTASIDRIFNNSISD